MTWSPVGQIAVSPTDLEVKVGDFSLEENDDLLFFRVTQLQPTEYWTFSFGLLTWRSSQGQELGTVKVFGSIYGETFRLGTGLLPLDRAGSVYFRPRSFNRAWININNPPLWELEFEAQSAKSSNLVPGDTFGDGPSAWSWADLAGLVLDWAFTSTSALIVPALPPGAVSSRSKNDQTS